MPDASWLIEFALDNRDSNDQDDVPLVRIAVRDGAARAGRDGVWMLLPLLEAGHLIDTSFMAVKMIGRIFESNPPNGVDKYTDLVYPVTGITKSLLNPYAIIESAAMAQLAVHALVAMGSSDGPKASYEARKLGVQWFTDQLRGDLIGLRSRWSDATKPVSDEVQAVLDLAIMRLEW